MKEIATCQEKYFPFFKNESTKKGIILQKETARLTKVGQVETVGSFGLCFINPQLKLLFPFKMFRFFRLKMFQHINHTNQIQLHSN